MGLLSADPLIIPTFRYIPRSHTFTLTSCDNEPCYRREDRAMPLYISICKLIEFYNDIVRFLCHSTYFLLVFVC